MNMNSITISFSRVATYVEELRAEVDPTEYAEWCVENGRESDELDSLRDYIQNDYCGDLDQREGYCEDSEFRDFDDAEYANMLTKAAGIERTARTDEELRAIARAEIHCYGTQGRTLAALKWARELTELEAHKVYTLVQNATISV